MLGGSSLPRVLAIGIALSAAMAGVTWAQPNYPSPDSYQTTGAMANAPTLHRFMSSRHQALQQVVDQVMQGDGNHRLVVTMGNEAADLDSMVTAITYSYWRHLAEPSQSSATVFIPLINIPRDEFRLRPECERVIEQTAQIPSNDLVFVNDPSIEALFNWLQNHAQDEDSNAATAGLDIILVDHAAPNREQKFLESFVRGVLDHHKEEHKFSDARPRWVTPVGSATTLTTLEGYALLGGQGHSSSAQSTNSSSASDLPSATSLSLLPSSLDGASGNNEKGWFSEIVRSQPGLFHLLLAPIVTDTSNFSPNAGKTKPEDEEAAALVWDARPSLASLLPSPPARNAVEALDMAAKGLPFPLFFPESCSNSGDSSNSPCQTDYLTAWHDDIARARQNVSHLTGNEFLRKDYKQWALGGLEVGFSSVIWPLEKWFQRDGQARFEHDIRNFARTKQVDLLVVMTMYTHHAPRGFERELLLYAPSFYTGANSPGNVPFFDHRAQLLKVLDQLQASELNLTPYRPKNRRQCVIAPTYPDASQSTEKLGQRGYIIFDQANVKASRKQVQPIIKSALEGPATVNDAMSATG